MKYQLILLLTAAVTLSGCSMVQEGMCAMRSNTQAIDWSTEAIMENAQAIDAANRAIEENRRQIEAVNRRLEEVNKS